MLESMEGRRGMPRLRPPFPAQYGYLGRPTLINNVETLAHVAARSACAAAGLDAPGTALVGDRARSREPGCYEAPLDVTTRAAGRRVRRRLRPTRSARSSPAAPRAGSSRRRRSTSPLTRDAPARVGRGPRLGRRAGLPRLVSRAAPARRDDALLRRGVVPEVHAVPDRQPRAPPPRPRSSSDGEAAMTRRRSRSGSRRWRRPRSAGSARPRRSRCGTAFRYWPELFAPLEEAVERDAMVEFTLDGREVDARPRASCSSTPPRATASSSRRSATTTSSTRTAAAACAWSTSRARRGRCRPARRASPRGWSSRRTRPCRSFQRTLTEMLLSEHLNASPGGRPNELARPRRGARRRGAARAPRREARAVRRPQPADGLRPRRLHPLRPLRPLHAGGHAVLGAVARGPRRPRRAIVPTWEPLAGSTPSASSAAAASRSARRARSTRSSRRARRPATSARSSKTKTTCTFCGVGCQIDLNVDPQTKRIVKVTSKPEYVSNDGNLCVKGRFAFNFVHHPDRLTRAARPRRGRRAPPDHLGARARGRGRPA